jgi:hypothetical protein
MEKEDGHEHYSPMELSDTKTESIAAYAAETPIVAWFEVFINIEIIKENTMIQIEMIINVLPCSLGMKP